jgi:hypothetical protein
VALASAGGALFSPYVSSKEVAEAAAAAKVVGATAERNFPAQQYRVGEGAGAGAGAQPPQRVFHPALDLANVGQLGKEPTARPREAVRFSIEGGNRSSFGDEEILRLKNMVRKVLEISINQVSFKRGKKNAPPLMSLAEITTMKKQAHDAHKDGVINREQLQEMLDQCSVFGVIQDRCVVKLEIDEGAYALVNSSGGYSADEEEEAAEAGGLDDVEEALKAGILGVFHDLVDDVQVDWCRYE